MVAQPATPPARSRPGPARHEWRWTASFEAFSAFPAAVVPGGQVPAGTYRFVVDGVQRDGGADNPYHLESAPFDVQPWGGVAASDARVEPDGAVSFAASSVYPRTYDVAVPLPRRRRQRPAVPHVQLPPVGTRRRGRVGGRDVRRPARRPHDACVAVDGRWVTADAILPGEVAPIAPGDLRDAFGETNASPITLVEL